MTLLIISAVLAAYFIGLSKGGFANFGMLAVPLMALAMPTMQAASLTLPIFVLSDIMALYLYRHVFSARNLKILIPSGIAGAMFGWATASYLSEDWMKLFIGVIGFIFCIYLVLKPKNLAPKPANIPRGIFWGILTGLTSFVSHSGAPPYQVYTLPQKMAPEIFAGTTTFVFAAINFSKIIPYIALGQMGFENIKYAIFLLPIAFAGIYTGWKAAKLLPEKLFFQIVQWALFIVSLKLIYDGLTHIL
ncbi:sulfite exporter TauE/SafE family protein [Bartonella sp. HY329]|uniref:sulfite exporter TauE/SafE family protein n=1 Tax=unclassified Bartonella TaxID=2645622 RepID=UPI0021CA61ED|nr:MULTISPECIES: sulfite exporter TauE/SafE family protein [unclassified Bartonella]UXM94415.1 sulfite exporter TauE/SafE family protein [Bartonella sp. HY329]UXN08739.1 sulfite exporter TauE/SafE family protein [Bartonella sp. HY328]